MDDPDNQLIAMRQRLTKGLTIDATFSGGDGSDCEHAVVVLGADSIVEGAEAERIWLQQHEPGFTYQGSSIGSCDPNDDPKNPKRFCEVYRILVGGAPKMVCFDVTEYFKKGKYV